MAEKIKSCCAASRNLEDTKVEEEIKNIQTPKTKSNEGMVYLPGGEFLMGTDYEYAFAEDGEGPVRQVKVDPFYMDTCAVSNADFKKFIEGTGYVTEAEK